MIIIIIIIIIHSFSVTAYSVRVAGCWSLSQLTLGERRGSPWTSRQVTAGLTHRDRQPLTLTFTPTGNSESPINLHACLWTVGGSRRTWREPTQTRGEHANSAQKGPAPATHSNSRPSCCEAAVLTTAPPCRPAELVITQNVDLQGQTNNNQSSK